MIIVVVGLFLRVDFPPHRPLKASSLAEFLHALLKLMEWPQKGFPPFMILSYLPLALLAWDRWRARTRDSLHSWDCVVICVGIWSAAQLVATAYSRGAGAPEPATRYLDSLNAGVFVNFIAGTGPAEPLPAIKVRLRSLASADGHGVVPLRRSRLCPADGRAFPRHCGAHPDLVPGHDPQSGALRLHEGQTLAARPFDTLSPTRHLLIEFVGNPVLRSLLPVSVRDAIPVAAEIHDGFDEQRVSDHSPAFSHGTFWTSHAKHARALGQRLAPTARDALPAIRSRWEIRSLLAEPDSSSGPTTSAHGCDRSLLPNARSGNRPADVYVRVPDQSVPHRRHANAGVDGRLVWFQSAGKHARAILLLICA
jgi:hypothetical protein